jgi:hypothetical protein
MTIARKYKLSNLNFDGAISPLEWRQLVKQGSEFSILGRRPQKTTGNQLGTLI